MAVIVAVITAPPAEISATATVLSCPPPELCGVGVTVTVAVSGGPEGDASEVGGSEVDGAGEPAVTDGEARFSDCSAMMPLSTRAAPISSNRKINTLTLVLTRCSRPSMLGNNSGPEAAPRRNPGLWPTNGPGATRANRPARARPSLDAAGRSSRSSSSAAATFRSWDS